MNGYLIPANAKKGTLILNVFRPIDAIIFGVGAFVSLLLLVIVNSTNTIGVLISIMPVAITGFLVIPVPNYHNVMCAIQSIIRYFSGIRNYKWRGWCFYEKFGKEETK